MDAVSLVFILVFFVWFPIEFVTGELLAGARRRGAEIKILERGSINLVHYTVYPALIVAFILAWYKVTMLPDWTFYLGLILLAAGVIIRQWAVLTLGCYFSEQVGVQEGQKVVDTGPYHFIRHPAYTGVLIAFLGIGIAISSWGATVLLLVVFALAYGYRISVEEKALASRLGEGYILYMKRTKRLIPFIL